MNWKVFFFLNSVICIAIACNNGDILKPEKIDTYLSETSEERTMKVNFQDSCIYSLVYIPTEVAFLKAHNGKTSKTELDSLQKHRNDYVNFQFRIEPTENFHFQANHSFENSLTSDEKRSKYIVEEMKNDFFIIAGKDTIKPVFYHYEKQFGLKNEILIHLSFPGNFKKFDSSTLYFINRLINKTEIAGILIDKETINKPLNIEL
ncbi:MAG: hypothetical protein KG003_09450 [Bacteroidetes bacterium]|nr:hypothetical protein [Bacteroidota bacterium]